jgi:hypothetical protein
MGRHPKHVDPAGSHLEYEQHVQPLQEDGVHGEEVHRQHALGLGPEDLPPGDGRPDRCRVDTGQIQDGPDGAGPNRVAEAAQLAVDATVAEIGFSLANRTTNARSSAVTAGRPRRCGFLQRRRTRS